MCRGWGTSGRSRDLGTRGNARTQLARPSASGGTSSGTRTMAETAVGDAQRSPHEADMAERKGTVGVRRLPRRLLSLPSLDGTRSLPSQARRHELGKRPVVPDLWPSRGLRQARSMRLRGGEDKEMRIDRTTREQVPGRTDYLSGLPAGFGHEEIHHRLPRGRPAGPRTLRTVLERKCRGCSETTKSHRSLYRRGI